MHSITPVVLLKWSIQLQHIFIKIGSIEVSRLSWTQQWQCPCRQYPPRQQPHPFYVVLPLTSGKKLEVPLAEIMEGPQNTSAALLKGWGGLKLMICEIYGAMALSGSASSWEDWYVWLRLAPARSSFHLWWKHVETTLEPESWHVCRLVREQTTCYHGNSCLISSASLHDQSILVVVCISSYDWRILETSGQEINLGFVPL